MAEYMVTGTVADSLSGEVVCFEMDVIQTENEALSLLHRIQLVLDGDAVFEQPEYGDRSRAVAERVQAELAIYVLTEVAGPGYEQQSAIERTAEVIWEHYTAKWGESAS